MMLSFALMFVFLALPCAIYSASSGVLKCYQCMNVNDPSLCNTETTCQQDEVCGIENHASLSGSLSYSMGCKKKHPCVEAMRFRLEVEQLLGKRGNLNTCSVCCGNSLCNTDDCYALERKLLELWKNGRLDRTDLTYNYCGGINDCSDSPSFLRYVIFPLSSPLQGTVERVDMLYYSNETMKDDQLTKLSSYLTAYKSYSANCKCSSSK